MVQNKENGAQTGGGRSIPSQNISNVTQQLTKTARLPIIFHICPLMCVSNCTMMDAGVILQGHHCRAIVLWPSYTLFKVRGGVGAKWDLWICKGEVGVDLSQ